MNKYGNLEIIKDVKYYEVTTVQLINNEVIVTLKDTSQWVTSNDIDDVKEWIKIRYRNKFLETFSRLLNRKF
jgi:hypothetical protein